MCFTCKGYREIECLVREVTGLRQMLECTGKTITGQGLEEKRRETGNRMAGFEEAEENEKSEGLKRVMTPDQHFDRTDPDRKGVTWKRFDRTKIRGGWQSMGWCSSCASKRKWDLWDSFVGKEEIYMRDDLHLSGKGDAVFAEGLSGAVASGLGEVRYLN